MIIGNTALAGIGNNSHTVLLIQSDQADAGTVFTDTSSGGAVHVIGANGGIDHKTTVGSPVPSLHSSSIRFEGAKFLNVTDSVDFALGSGDFTAEAWCYPDDGSDNWQVVGQRDDAGGNAWVIAPFARDVWGGVSSAGGANAWARATDGAIVDAAWQHIVMQRVGSSVSVYLDGVRGATVLSYALAVNDSAIDLTIGRTTGGSRQLAGYMAEIRITKGHARYPVGGFTVPNRMN